MIINSSRTEAPDNSGTDRTAANGHDPGRWHLTCRKGQAANNRNMKKELENKFFIDEASFRKWLGKNHGRCQGIWLIFFRKQSGKECISYSEALDTALCYGWIDSIIRKIDDTRYVRKFTPRNNISNWSDINKRRVIELIGNGKMTEAGLMKIESYRETGAVTWEKKDQRHKMNIDHIVLPESVMSALAENEPALTNFHKLAPTYQRHYILWITSARREKTLKSRMQEAIALLKENRRLGLK